MANPTPVPDPNHNELYTLLAALLGGLLSAIGGFFAVVIRARMDKKAEIIFIQTALDDELTTIITIIDNLNETCRTTHQIPNSYLNDLNDNKESFNYHRLKIFLIKDSDLRRSIVAFYKELDEAIKDSINKVGTLGKEEKGAHDQIASQFINLKTTASTLKSNLLKYQYKVFLFF
jgi:hypothetical protein